jgi:alkaline phosphatase D
MDENTVGLTGSWDSRISRRTLLRTGGAAAVLLYGGAVPSASAGTRFASYPFTLGVASGDPTPDGIVLWTRLAPDPLNGGGLGEETYLVRFEVAADPDFRRIVQRGHTRVGPEEVHTVHGEVQGLQPSHDYWYRFESKDEISPVGRLRTAPPAGTTPERLTFAYVSCQNYTHGYFPAFEDLAQQDLELVVHLGDYIYEGAGLVGGVRTHTPAAPLMTLEDYRTRHAQYKTDTALQAAHAAFPWLMTWDDHEFWNNYADLDLDPNQPLETVAQRRAAAYLAYWEHSPLPRSRKPVGQDMPMYRRSAWGDLALFHVLDTRQHRSDQVSCTVAQRLPNGYCPEALNPARAILGEEQRAWLLDGLAVPTARWDVLANQVRFAPLDQDAAVARRGFGNDNWDGYVADRQRVLDVIASRPRPANAIVITGDAHVHSVRNVPPDFENFDAPPVATEFIGSSISSQDGDWPKITTTFGGDAQNPHRLFQTNQRGYVRVEVTPESWRSEHRIVDALQEHAPASTLATFVVADGEPGAIQEFPTPTDGG